MLISAILPSQKYGREFREEIVEYRPGAARGYVESVQSQQAVDVECVAASYDARSSMSNSLSNDRTSSNTSCRRPNQGKEDQIIAVQNIDSTTLIATPTDNKEYILLCRDMGKTTTLFHADVTKALRNYTSYHVLHDMYYGNRLQRCFILKEIHGVEFVKVCSINMSIKHF